MDLDPFKRMCASLASIADNASEMSKGIALLAEPMLEFQNRIAELCKPIQINFKQLEKVLQGFSAYSQALRANDILIKHQFVFTETLNTSVSNAILNSKSPEKWIEDYYFGNNEQCFQELLNHCKVNLKTKSKKHLMDECEQAYLNQHYHLACVGLFSLADGLLTEFTENNVTSVSKRLKKLYDTMIVDKPASNHDVRLFFILDAMFYWDEENDAKEIKCRPLFSFYDFNNPEPDFLNRHWIVHGRTERNFSRLDVLRILQWIDGLFYLVNPQKNNPNEVC